MIAAVCSYLVGRKDKALRDRVVQLCCLGQQGLIRMAELSMERGHALAEGIKALPGFKLLNDAPFGNEFAVVTPKAGCDIVKAMLKTGIPPDFIVVDGKEGGTGSAPILSAR